jgi:diguanylate cyclase (GGDEF)-like protein
MPKTLKRLAADAAVQPEERVLAGRVGGWMYALGGVTVPSFLLLRGAHTGWILGLGGVALLVGLTMALLIDWRRAPVWLIHTTAVGGFGMVAGVVASSGATQSPGWLYLFFVTVFAGYFFPPGAVAVYVGGCMFTQSLPLVYDQHWTQSHYIVELIIALPSYAMFGMMISLGKRLMRRLHDRAKLLAAEQAALRRIATAVIEGESSADVYALVSREAAALLGGGAAGILRFDSDTECTVVGSWADHEGGRYAPGTVVPVRPGSELQAARMGRQPNRVEDHPQQSPVGRLGYAKSVVVPVSVGGQNWGAIAVAAAESVRLTAVDESQLMEFADLLASAIASLDDRARLTAEASTDPLTGLANRRALHDRLAAEMARSLRHEQTLSVVVIDVDNFKHVNDSSGHEAGDALLIAVAQCLSENARAEDTLGRLGGDEFAWIMPETTREQALVATERARRMIAATCQQPYRVTVSAGICDTRVSEHAAELIRYADSALYWSKAHGRNRSWIFDPEVLHELGGSERAGLQERSNAILGLQALARAIDAKDSTTSQHSERVASLAAGLARAAGWTADQAMLLKEAALVHDVGKVGVSDAVLGKPDLLTAEERTAMCEHAELSARIVEGVLAAEQVDWIRCHHEKPDGTGYPQGLIEAEIPEGAALLAVADAWEVMTSGRAYSAAKHPAVAISECAKLVGRQFTKLAVGALLKLHAAGELDRHGGQVQPGAPLPEAQ